MDLKNSSQDFRIKKEFIDIQLDLKKFLEETDVFTLFDLLRDPLVVHSIEDYAAAYKELDELKKIRKTLGRLLKVKKRQVSLQNIIKDIDPFTHKTEDSPRVCFPDDCSRKSLFALNPVMPDKELTKDRMVQLFKEHMRSVESIGEATIQRPVFSRSFSTSSSHSHLMKKIEKSGDLSQSVFQKGGSEITSATSFRNGILRNATHADKPKSHASSRPAKSKTSESAHQSLQNPHEVLSSSSKYPKEPRDTDSKNTGLEH